MSNLILEIMHIHFCVSRTSPGLWVEQKDVTSWIFLIPFKHHQTSSMERQTPTNPKVKPKHKDKWKRTPVTSQTEHKEFHHSGSKLLHPLCIFLWSHFVNESYSLEEQIVVASEAEEWEESVLCEEHLSSQSLQAGTLSVFS